MTPDLFAATRYLIAGRTKVWLRSGHDSSLHRPTHASFEEHVDELRHTVERSGPTVLVGINAGGSMALALAMQGCAEVVGVVTHEPLVGRLDSERHQQLEAAAELLGVSPERASIEAAMSHLYSPASWKAIPEPSRRWALRHHETIGNEIAEFATFDPHPGEFAALGVPHLTTFGSRSRACAPMTAAALGRTGAQVAEIADAGHLAPIENPQGFVRALHRLAVCG